jgi:antirestriction protein ArdC
VRDLYRSVTDQILAELKTGVRPWVKPWSRTPGLNVPCNAVSGRPYSGVNTLLLWTARHHGWPQPRFLTFKQAVEAGGHVRKGEHAQHVVFVKDLRVKEDDSEAEERRVRMLRSYTVFNIAQCDDLSDKLTAPPKGLNLDQRDVEIDQFIAAVGAKVQENSYEPEAYYSHGLDHIVLPGFESFRSRSQYIATLFHELVHWTGHASRLDRQLGTRFGKRSKAAEELVAELGAAFLCAEFAVDGFIPHAAYIESYLELLTDDPKPSLRPRRKRRRPLIICALGCWQSRRLVPLPQPNPPRRI